MISRDDDDKACDDDDGGCDDDEDDEAGFLVVFIANAGIFGQNSKGIPYTIILLHNWACLIPNYTIISLHNKGMLNPELLDNHLTTQQGMLNPELTKQPSHYTTRHA